MSNKQKKLRNWGVIEIKDFCSSRDSNKNGNAAAQQVKIFAVQMEVTGSYPTRHFSFAALLTRGSFSFICVISRSVICSYLGPKFHESCNVPGFYSPFCLLPDTMLNE